MKVKGSKNKFLEPLNKVDFCEVSKASAEIMLERFCKGKKIDFVPKNIQLYKNFSRSSFLVNLPVIEDR